MEGGRPLARNKRENRKSRPAPRSNASTPTVLDRARDELFSAIRQCGVLGAARDEQLEWMEETLGFMRDRHPELGAPELAQLRDGAVRRQRALQPLLVGLSARLAERRVFVAGLSAGGAMAAVMGLSPEQVVEGVQRRLDELKAIVDGLDRQVAALQ